MINFHDSGECENFLKKESLDVDDSSVKIDDVASFDEHAGPGKVEN